MEIQALQQKILKNIENPSEVEIKEIVIDILKLLEWKFIFSVEYFSNEKELDAIFNLLKSKNRTARRYEWVDGSYGVEATLMDRDFFTKNSDKLFFLSYLDYEFKDSKNKITLNHDGDFKINNS